MKQTVVAIANTMNSCFLLANHFGFIQARHTPNVNKAEKGASIKAIKKKTLKLFSTTTAASCYEWLLL